MLGILKKQSNTSLAIMLVLTGVLLLAPLHVTEASFLTDPLGTIWGGIQSFFFNVFVTIGSAVLFFGAVILDTAFRELVIKMGLWLNGSAGVGQAVILGWTMLRDVINMLFIFALIYLGLKTILNSEDSNTRRQLGYLVLAALLINFSLFISQVVVDFSNLLATQMYTQIVGEQTKNDPSTSNAHATSPIAGAFLTRMGISTALSLPGTTGPSARDHSELRNPIFYGFLTMIFFIMAGFSFMWGGLLIVSRFVALILFMVFSPLMFMGWILPKFKNVADKWWDDFFKYCFFAPIYIFMIYLSIKFLDGVLGMNPNNGLTFSSAFDGSQPWSASMASLLLNFLIMIGLLWASLKVADRLSIYGGSVAAHAFEAPGRHLRSGLVSAGANAGNFAFQNTIGWGLHGLMKGMEGLDKKAEGGKYMATRGAAKLIRGIAGGEATRRALEKGRNFGVGGTDGWADTEKMNTERSARARASNRLDRLEGDLLSGDHRKVTEALNQMTDAEIVALVSDPKKRDKHVANNIHLIRSSGRTAVKKAGEKLGDDTIDTFNKDFETKILAELGETGGPGRIYDQHKKNLADLPTSVLTDSRFADHLLDVKSLRALASSDNLDPSALRIIKGHVERKVQGTPKEREMTRFFRSDLGKAFG